MVGCYSIPCGLARAPRPSCWRKLRSSTPCGWVPSMVATIATTSTVRRRVLGCARRPDVPRAELQPGDHRGGTVPDRRRAGRGLQEGHARRVRRLPTAASVARDLRQRAALETRPRTRGYLLARSRVTVSGSDYFGISCIA